MATLDLIGSSEKFQAVLEDVGIVAQAACSFLLQGETRTGKEVKSGRPRSFDDWIFFGLAAGTMLSCASAHRLSDGVGF
jgi:hypothetical protein